MNSTQKPKKILFLYTELASYFAACLNVLSNASNIEIHLVRLPVNKEAPFQFFLNEKIKVYEKNNFSAKELENLGEIISPDLIYCSGWIEKDYLKICKKFKNKIPVILGLDNSWEETFKQKIATLISPFTILKSFSHCWIPGKPQLSYAEKLGFPKKNILKGFYSADVDFFRNIYIDTKKQKENKMPHRLIFVGRYYEFKGIKDLWQAFIELKKETENDWELWCLGVGDIAPIQHPNIKHFGFIQASEMAHFIKETSVFVLPSHKEPWGVVVHEFAAAGFPLICSDKVGAASAFIEQNKNGYIYPSGNIKELKNMLKKIFFQSDKELFEMAEISAEKALQITPEKWTSTILSLINN
ncbi:MAG: glycosyltransferase [Bacteroidia bacterium]